MKLLAITDTYIPEPVMTEGLRGLARLGIDLTVRRWEHESLVGLQEANLVVEERGPDAITLPDEVLADLDSFELVITQFAPLGRRFIEAATRLKVIGVLRGGVENIDLAAATQRGVCVMNTPGRNARAVAECTLGLILGEIRNLARAHAAIKAGQWRRDFPNADAIPELYEKTVGLIGYGEVGRLVAQYLAAFGSKVVVYDPFFRGDPYPAVLVDLPALLRQSDVVTLHARLTESNRGLLGAEQLAMMKPSAVLVNTARSGLIVEAALVDALQRRQIQGAALDVFDIEPLPADHPLLALDNVTLTPHLAGSTIDAFHKSPQRMVGHLSNLLGGGANLPIVNGMRPSFNN